MARRSSQPTPKTRPAAAASPEGSPQASRRHSRYPVTLPVVCTRSGPRAAGTWRGRTADISGGGFAIDLPVRLRPRSPVTVQVRTGIGPMRLDAEILWTRSVPGRPGTVRHGLCLAQQSEILQLPFGVLLGQWLRLLSRAPAGRKKSRPAPGPRRG